jgi:hypothetical protein
MKNPPSLVGARALRGGRCPRSVILKMIVAKITVDQGRTTALDSPQLCAVNTTPLDKCLRCRRKSIDEVLYCLSPPLAMVFLYQFR